VGAGGKGGERGAGMLMVVDMTMSKAIAAVVMRRCFAAEARACE